MRLLAVVIGDGCRCGRIERQTSFVEQLVEHEAERVNIDGPVVAALRKHDLGRHVVRRALPGKAGGGAAQAPCYTEISQLIVAGLTDKNVLGLDIAVNNILFPADFQRRSGLPPTVPAA